MLIKPILEIGYGFTHDDNMELRIVVERKGVEEKVVELISLDKQLEVKIDKLKEKRSLDSNSYMWILCTKIAEIIRSTKEDVYRKAVREVGVFEDLPIKTELVDKWVERWESGRLGWFSESVRVSKMDGYTVVRSYYGSSVYDSKEMWILIQYIIDEAQGLGIDTRTPDEIKELMSKWEK